MRFSPSWFCLVAPALGALAGLLDHDVPADHAARWPTIQVTLRKPPPLDTPLPVADGVATDASGAAVAAVLWLGLLVLVPATRRTLRRVAAAARRPAAVVTTA